MQLVKEFTIVQFPFVTIYWYMPMTCVFFGKRSFSA